jgi:hypothetical protein
MEDGQIKHQANSSTGLFAWPSQQMSKGLKRVIKQFVKKSTLKFYHNTLMFKYTTCTFWPKKSPLERFSEIHLSTGSQYHPREGPSVAKEAKKDTPRVVHLCIHVPALPGSNIHVNCMGEPFLTTHHSKKNTHNTVFSVINVMQRYINIHIYIYIYIYIYIIMTSILLV